MTTQLEFLSELTSMLSEAPPSHGILGIYLVNHPKQIHMEEGPFLRLFPSYKEEVWDHGTYSSKLVITMNGMEVFCLSNMIRISGEVKEGH
ncbi:MAG: hypothetical protein US20_C0026G0016 [Candidatus Pacebacteria bacterium GW2011_GWF1_36_5]|nr:MAG: hypothetical protein US20_C0026G0016 [Candidatus Pacebacteria bacterium GW2011_GWF1_36_5]